MIFNFNKERGFWAIVYREMVRICSRPIYLVALVIIPLFCFVFFATLMPNGLPERLPIGVVDQDNSSVSRNVTRQVDATSANHIIEHYRYYAEARAALQTGQIYGFFVMPKGLERDASSGRQPKVTYYYTQAFYIPGSLTMKNMNVMMATVSGAVDLKMRQARGQSTAEAMGQIQPIVPDIHPIGNPYINYSVYLINLIIPGMLELMVLLTTVFSIGSELKKKTSRVWIKMAGYKLHVALLAKMLPYTVIYFLMGFLYNTILFRYLHYPLNCDIRWMLVDTVMMIMAAQCMGIFMIGLLPVLRDALSFASLYGVLAFSFSGFSFPIEGMLPFIQGLSYIFPLRYYFKIYQHFALNGLEFRYQIWSFIALCVFIIFPLVVSLRLKRALIYQNYPRK